MCLLQDLIGIWKEKSLGEVENQLRGKMAERTCKARSGNRTRETEEREREREMRREGGSLW